jgi:hypothetical protein
LNIQSETSRNEPVELVQISRPPSTESVVSLSAQPPNNQPVLSSKLLPNKYVSASEQPDLLPDDSSIMAHVQLEDQSAVHFPIPTASNKQVSKTSIDTSIQPVNQSLEKPKKKLFFTLPKKKLFFTLLSKLTKMKR